MNTLEIRNAVAKAAEACGAEGYEISISASVSAGAEALKDEINSVTYSRSSEMSVRCVKEGKSGYARSELITPEEAAELVYAACENALIVDDKDEMPLFEGSKEYTVFEEEPVHLMSAEELIANTMELQTKTYALSDKIVDGTQAFTSCASEESAFINSAGIELSHESAIVYHGVGAAVKVGDEGEEDYEFSLIGKKSTDELAKLAVETALSKIGAETPDSGKYSIIMDKSSMRSMLGVFSSVFSARAAFMKTSLLAGKEGEKIASDILSIVDDPFYPDKFGHCPFDGEGVAVYKKDVIKNGVLETLLYNRMYAKLMGKETTGNAVGAKNIAPKGLYIVPGDLTEEQLLEKLGNGIYITGLQGLHAGADTQSGDFSLQATGFLVENGKKTKPVKNFTIADNFFSFIKKVEAIADTVDFGTSSAVGSPEVMFSDIAVSGK